jgi:protein-tyrosine phosphatase
MFGLFRKKTTQQDIQRFSFQHDIHCHVLPGLDDGAPDVATSLELIKGQISMGMTRVTATPHIIGDLYRNTPQKIHTALELLKRECIAAGISIELNAAAEYMLDDYFLQLVRTKQPLLTIHNNIVLVELPYSVLPDNLEEIVFQLMTAGYQPILAHPERYQYYHNDYKNYFHLKDLGFLFQVNLLSFTPHYGKGVTKAAHFIMEHDLVDHVGSDMHHPRHVQMIMDNIHLIQGAIGDTEYNVFA